MTTTPLDPRMVGYAIALLGWLGAGVLAIFGPGDAVVAAALIAAAAQIYTARSVHRSVKARRLIITKPAKDSPTLVLDELLDDDQAHDDGEGDDGR